jgi:serine/threonine protein kinase
MALTAAQLSVVGRLLDEALPLDAGARARWLDALPPEHELLKPALREMLRQAGAPRSAGDLDDPLWQLERQLRAEPRIFQSSQLIGPYRLLSELSRADLNSVWLAVRADDVERKVALVLPHAESIDSGLGQRIVRERAVLAELTHPNIARLYDTGWSEGGQPFIALEHVEGQSIDAWCADRRQSVRERVRLLASVVRVVAFAHARNVVHGDIKPANVVLTRAGKLKLLNFGLAKLLSSSTNKTPRAELAYAAPEQINGARVSAATDIYSLGVILYGMLSERGPYSLFTKERRELEDAILHQHPVGPSRLAKDRVSARELQGSLDAIVLKALRKQPRQRYETATAFADDLGGYLEGHTAAAEHDTRWYRLPDRLTGNELAVIALVAALAIASVVLALVR